MKVVPDCDEGDTEKQAECSPKVCYLLNENHDIEFENDIFTHVSSGIVLKFKHSWAYTLFQRRIVEEKQN